MIRSRRRLTGIATTIALLLVVGAVATATPAQQNRIDTVTFLAPELARYGKYDVGVRTLQVTDNNRVDILNTREGEPPPRYDRTLTVEVWYPAALAAGQKPGGEYRTLTRDPAISATLYGKGVRGASPISTGGAFPLVIVSHGYPGDRYLMIHLCENLASKGLVVASIEHKDSTYDDQQTFGSTLYNRPFDQLFVLNEMARLGRAGSGSFLSGLVNDRQTGLVGYSMGGYGLINAIGGAFSKASETFPRSPPNRLLAERGVGNAKADPRIKAAIAIAPWGMQNGFWDAEGLKGIRTPVMFVSGSADEVSGYENGTKALFTGAVNTDRYLLTYLYAGHNAGAPIPAPLEAYASSPAARSSPFTHYADPVWDTTRMNNILVHFATAWFELYLKGDSGRQAYLDSSWKGFKPRTAIGLTLEHLPAAR